MRFWLAGCWVLLLLLMSNVDCLTCLPVRPSHRPLRHRTRKWTHTHTHQHPTLEHTTHRTHPSLSLSKNILRPDTRLHLYGRRCIQFRHLSCWLLWHKSIRIVLLFNGRYIFGVHWHSVDIVFDFMEHRWHHFKNHFREYYRAAPAFVCNTQNTLFVNAKCGSHQSTQVEMEQTKRFSFILPNQYRTNEQIEVSRSLVDSICIHCDMAYLWINT